MKKKISILLAILLIINTVCMTVASAAATEKAATSFGSTVFSVKYNGETVVFPDAQPFVDSNNRTLVPVRFVALTMGAAVDWNQQTQTATIVANGTTINITIGKDTLSIIKNGSTSAVKMDTVAVNEENRTYVPIRFVAEALGAWVGYSDLFNTVQIYQDQLTPAEITKLHSYPDKSLREFNPNAIMTDADYAELYPQIAYTTGTNGPENANEWMLRNPSEKKLISLTGQQPTTFTGAWSKEQYTYGQQPDINCAKLAMNEVIAYTKSVNTNYGDKIHIDYRTDLSCVFWSKHLGDSGVMVRGVAEITIPKTVSAADIKWVEKSFDLIDVVPGDVFTVDMEFGVAMTSPSVQVSYLISR